MDNMSIGDKVTPITPAGVCLRYKPTTGKYKENFDVSCVFTGVGTIIHSTTVIIDYDSWPDYNYVKLGKIEYKDCLIKCKNGYGWAGAGALLRVEESETIQKRFTSSKARGCTSRSDKIRRRALVRRSRVRNRYRK